MNFSLIVPIAADCENYKQQIPHVFQMAADGSFLCIKAIQGLDLSLFDQVYFTILKKLDEQYSLKEMLQLQFQIKGLKNAEVVVLDEPTSSQPETIYRTICEKNITGSIFIKDADCSFNAEIVRQNSVAIYPLESMKWVNPQNKSYVAVDDMFYVTNIIEKKIVSHYFSAGGYCFESAEEFCEFYLRFGNRKGLYLSHIIYAMLLSKRFFRPIVISEYHDFDQE